MQSIISFATRRPGAYLAICCGIGATIRLGLARGDWGLFFNPLWPLF